MSNIIRAGTTAALRPAHKPVAKVQPTGNLKNDTANQPGKIENPAERAEKLHQLTGPTPAFQTSLLELEADITYVIRKMAAAREIQRNANAVEPEKPATSNLATPSSQV